MANMLSRFNKIAVGSKGKISDYTARISSIGDFTRVENIETILSSWNNILLTPTRTYTFDPEYGSDLVKYIFEPADNETAESIRDEIHYRLGMYDNRAKVTDIEVFFLSSGKGFGVNIHAEYQGEKASLSALIDESVYFNFLRAS